MASRQYRRDNSGKFASASAGTKVTTGRAGGFANAAHRNKVSGQSAKPSVMSSAAKRAGVKKAATVAGAVAAGAVVRRGVGGRSTVKRSNPGRVGTALKGVVQSVGRAGKALK